ncbi:sialate O-acetylesterase [Sphingobacterium gobiense]|uniref:Sialate O-acetylesterase n=2 Tax=Sphingobacterium gobiense TaxID=1382456 RepID=A0A2S9JNS2_9SPHI|nr:sialate O-acetylesterase [Sphingobacterium gobiense]
MVLQRNQPVVIFGTASQGEKITVSFDRQVLRTMADAQGNWKVSLKPMAANAVGQDLVIAGENTITLHDVLVGEVWLCSGQSNMEYQMRKLAKLSAPEKDAYFPKNAVEEANNPNIRLFLVRRKSLARPNGQYNGWAVAQGAALRQFSAVGYFFAKNLQEELDVPVGVISSSQSGSRIEPWLPEQALREEPYFHGKELTGDPGKFFDTMIAPLAPYTMKGFLWYQGESNVFLQENISYAYKQKVLIESWRKLWNDNNLPFYFTQIVPFLYSLDEQGKERMARTVLPEFWEAQSLLLQLPHTGRVTTTDLVDHITDLHPSYKWEIGRRLALQALAKTCHKPIEADGPTFQKVRLKGGKAHVYFDHAKGLHARDGKSLSCFEVAGKDGIFVNAAAKLKGDMVELTAPSIKKITEIRFAWDEAAQPNLVNEAGLPALSFRSNNPYQKLKLN